MKEINGVDFELMVKNALNNLINNENAINDMNVFPVPDGDTGTNMRLTLENGIKEAKPDKDLCDYLKDLSRGMLFGARGNSGVILSQLFKGLYEKLKHEDEVNTQELIDGFICAYETAYNAVVNPTEGTMLTVAREGIEKAKVQLNKKSSVEDLFTMYLSCIKDSLDKTPDLLPLLKEANVLDSGGYGFMIIIEGMTKYLYGEIIPGDKGYEREDTRQVINLSPFNENSEFEYGYCVDFLLQLLNSKCPVANFDINAFINFLANHGESIVAIQEGTRVKAHVHTKNPATIISYCNDFGDFLLFKMDNMTVQNHEKEHGGDDKLPYAIIAVGNGAGFKKLYTSFENVFFIDGGPTMNAPSSAFFDAIENTFADKIIILPNNKNTIMAAEQAKKLSGNENVVVIPTKTMVEGYYSIAMNLDSASTVDGMIECMQNGFSNVNTIAVSKSIKNAVCDGIECMANDYLIFINGSLKFAGSDLMDLLNRAFGSIENIDEASSCVVFTGRDCHDDICGEVESLVNRNYSSLEVMTMPGGQITSILTIGVA